ncbi:MAG: hypothetical protein KAT34_09715 [Candidatus Aminicenantes bacterium]|nr:hypothetical protein [Candidatus Aminicenantes bacterium]
MITRHVIKKEIDKVQEEYLDMLYKIVKVFENSTKFTNFEIEKLKKDEEVMEWHRFVDQYAGCLADDRIERGDQGKFEIREKLE